MKKKPELGISEAFMSRDRKERILNPFGDTDKDGVLNLRDCKPFDPTKHGGTYTPSGGGYSYSYKSSPSSGGGSSYTTKWGQTGIFVDGRLVGVSAGKGGPTTRPSMGRVYTYGGVYDPSKAPGGPSVYETLTPYGQAVSRATSGMTHKARGRVVATFEKAQRAPGTLTSKERSLIKPHLSEFTSEFRQKFMQSEMKTKLAAEKIKIRPTKDVMVSRVQRMAVPGLTLGLTAGITPESKELARRIMPSIVPTAISLAKKGIALSPVFLPIIPTVTIAKKVVHRVPPREIVRRYEAFIAPAVGIAKHKMDIARAYSEATTPKGLITAIEKTEGRKLTRTEREKVTRAFEKGEKVTGEYRSGFGLPAEEMKWEREGAKFQAKALSGQFRPAEEQFAKQIIEPVSVTVGGKRAKVIQQQEKTVQTNIKDMDRISIRHPEWRKPSGEIVLPTTLKPEVLRIEKNIEHLQVEAKNKGWVTSTGDLRYPDTAAGRSWARSYTDAIEKQKKYITPDGYYKSDYIKYTPEAQKYHDTYQKYETSQTKLESMPLPTPTKQFARGIGEAFVSIPIAPLFIGRVAAETIVAPTTAPLRAKRFGEEYAEFARKEPFRVSGQVAGMLIPAARRAPIVPKIIRGVKVTEAGKITYTGLGIRGIKEPKPVLGFYKEIARTPEGIGVQRAVVLGKKYPLVKTITDIGEIRFKTPELGLKAGGWRTIKRREVEIAKRIKLEKVKGEALWGKDVFLGAEEKPVSTVERLFLPETTRRDIALWKRGKDVSLVKKPTDIVLFKEPSGKIIKPSGIRIEKRDIPKITEMQKGRLYKLEMGYKAAQIGKYPSIIKIISSGKKPRVVTKSGEIPIHSFRDKIHKPITIEMVKGRPVIKELPVGMERYIRNVEMEGGVIIVKKPKLVHITERLEISPKAWEIRLPKRGWEKKTITKTEGDYWYKVKWETIFRPIEELSELPPIFVEMSVKEVPIPKVKTIKITKFEDIGEVTIGPRIKPKKPVLREKKIIDITKEMDIGEVILGPRVKPTKVVQRKMSRKKRIIDVTKEKPVEASFLPEEFIPQPEVAIVPKKVMKVVTTDYDKITKSLLKGKKMLDLSLPEYTEFLKNSIKKTNIIKVVDGYGIYATEWKGNIVYGAIDMKSGFGSISGRRSLKEIIVDIKEGVPAQLIRQDPIMSSVKGQYEYMKRIAAAEEKYGGKAQRFKGRKGDKVLDIGAGIQPDLRATHAIDLVKPGKKFKSLEYKHGYDFSKETTKLPYKDNTFDVIVSYGALGRNFESLAIYTEIRRVLKPGGRLEFNADSPKTDMFLKRTGFERPRMETYFDKSLNKEIGVIVVKKALFPEKLKVKTPMERLKKKWTQETEYLTHRIEEGDVAVTGEGLIQEVIPKTKKKPKLEEVTFTRVDEYKLTAKERAKAKAEAKKREKIRSRREEQYRKEFREPGSITERIRSQRSKAIGIFVPREKQKRKEKIRMIPILAEKHKEIEKFKYGEIEAIIPREREKEREKYMFKPVIDILPRERIAYAPREISILKPIEIVKEVQVEKVVPKEKVMEIELFKKPTLEKIRKKPEPIPEPEPKPLPEEDERKKIKIRRRRKEEYFKFGEVTGVLTPEEMRRRASKKRATGTPAKTKVKPRKKRSVVESYMLPM